MRKKRTHVAGFTFVESLITFSIVGIFLALTWSTITFLMLKSNDQVIRTRGHFLAVEGIEIVKQIRQTAVNRNKEQGFLELFEGKEGKFVIQKSGEEFKLEPGQNEIISSDQEPYTDYCRTIQIGGDAISFKQITSTVSWGNFNCNDNLHSISYSTYLTDLKK